MTARNKFEPALVDWVWALPNRGVTWCQCTKDPLTGQPPHQVTRPVVMRQITETLGSLPDELTTTEIGRVTMDLWHFPDVTPRVAQALMNSSQAVMGPMSRTYPTQAAAAIIRHFSQTWEG